jgi:disulfide bond formation protein DsbB
VAPANLARWIALLTPLALLGGAYSFQLFGHLYPCEMCWWQRYPHFAALVPAVLAFVAPPGAVRTLLVVAAGALIAVSGAIGVFHAGVEYHWWQGITPCTATTKLGGTPEEMLAALMKAPIIRCDVAQWRFAGISLAGFNAIASLGAAIVIFVLVGRPTAARQAVRA